LQIDSPIYLAINIWHQSEVHCAISKVFFISKVY